MASVTTTVTGTLKYPNGDAVVSAEVKAVRFQDSETSTSIAVSDTASATSNATTGVFSLSLSSNSTGGGTMHKITLPDGRFFRLNAPTSATTFALGTLTVYRKPAPFNEKDVTASIAQRAAESRGNITTAAVTIPTAAGNTDTYVISPVTGVLTSLDFSGTTTLATNDTNYVTFVVTNITNSSAAMLAATDANTTKVTGGSAITANVNRALTLNGTAANLVVTKGDRILVRYTGTGTLANTVTFAVSSLNFGV